MGQIESKIDDKIGKIESKVFDDAPPWDLEEIDRITDLDKDTINLLWRQWATDEITKKGKVTFGEFCKKLCVNEDNEDDVKEARKIFNLIDEDDDEKVEFPDLMLFIFCLDEEVCSFSHKLFQLNGDFENV